MWFQLKYLCVLDSICTTYVLDPSLRMSRVSFSSTSIIVNLNDFKVMQSGYIFRQNLFSLKKSISKTMTRNLVDLEIIC